MSEYVLSARMELKDNFSTNIRSARSSFEKLKDTVKVAATGVKNSIKEMNLSANDFKNFQKKMNTSLVAGSLAVGYGLKNAYMEYVNLNGQLVRNKAITGISKKENKELISQVKELGRTTKFTAKEVAEAQMYQAMAGYKTNEILTVTPTLLKLSIATGEDLAKTSDMVTDNLSAFGMSIKDVGMFSDTLASVANNTNTNVAMLGEAFTYVSSSSRALNEDFREVATMLGILADNGIKGSKAGENLNAMYMNLAKITPEMRKQMEKTNTTFYDSNGKFKGLRKIIMESKEPLTKLTESQRNLWLATIAGTRGAKIWASIMNSSAEGTKKAEEAAFQASGALEKFVNIMKNSDRQKIDELKSAYDGFKIALGEGISPIVLERMQTLTNYLNDMTDSDKLSTDNLESFFRSLERGAKVGIAALAGVNFMLLGIRATLGDPTAVAGLSLYGAAAGGYVGHKLAKYANKSNKKMEEEEEQGKKIFWDYQDEKNGRVTGNTSIFNEEKTTKDYNINVKVEGVDGVSEKLIEDIITKTFRNSLLEIGG